jgi:NADPH:quinone reductase-like Zn-dependent oxidoreductase
LHQGNFDNRHATFQQYSIVPADLVAKVCSPNIDRSFSESDIFNQIPAYLSFERAASLPAAVATAALGFYNTSNDGFGGLALTPPWEADGRGKYAGNAVLIIGGASSVGQQGK